jgi:hypothetical protein
MFGREADKLERANEDDRTYYLIEKEPLVNKFISVPKDKSSLNCASFTAGIVEAVLCGAGFVSTSTICRPNFHIENAPRSPIIGQCPQSWTTHISLGK